MEKLIWSNYPDDITVDEEFYKTEYPEIYAKGIEAMEEATYDDLYLYLDDEKQNLDIQLSGEILVIGNIGTWKGRRHGYKIIESGNISDILNSECDYSKWYSDGYNIKFIGAHHDGTNYYEYREIRDNVDIEKLLDKIYYGKPISRQLLNYYTKSILPQVAKVYGWETFKKVS